MNFFDELKLRTLFLQDVSQLQGSFKAGDAHELLKSFSSLAKAGGLV
jgi:hypothetical protein